MFLCVCVFACVSLQRTEERVLDSKELQMVEPSRGCWDSNSGPLDEKQVLLNAEPSL